MATPTNLPASWTTGEVLTASAINDLRGAFRVLQVVSFNTTAGATGSSSGTYIDTGVSLAITPQSSTSKILVLVQHSIYNSSAGTGAAIRLFRGATQLSQYYDIGYNAGAANSTSWCQFYLDSPASTSAQTYKTQFCRGVGSGTSYVQVNANPGSIVLCEISA